MSDWAPGCDLETLRARAQLLGQIRAFFAQRGVLEVETPLLASTTVTDVHIESWSASDGDNKRYLQTSPEYFMKRLLASEPVPIYQLGKVFRVDPAARHHNPEFTMLEWYRPGFSLSQLIEEVSALLRTVLGDKSPTGQIPRFSYADVFSTHLGINPHRVIPAELQSLTEQHIDLNSDDLTPTDRLQLLLDQKIIPQLPQRFFLTNYPEAQSALARTVSDEDGNRVAQRFELFCDGIEIANGYEELTDAAEQQRRFRRDLEIRQQQGKTAYPADEKLLAALHSGLPECAGVALGVDRLLMLKTGKKQLGEVLSFSADRA